MSSKLKNMKEKKEDNIYIELKKMQHLEITLYILKCKCASIKDYAFHVHLFHVSNKHVFVC
jgi:hypothetical protein